ncbi:MAG: chemotaxis protein [Moorea sp. SIO2B7]|nr:chemotaxis protein [Moorena sp. SIO2B7]
MSNLTKITLDSTLGDLPLNDFQVSPTTLGQVIANQFEQRPGLPGVIIADDSRILGMISRSRFKEEMSKAYTQEAFLKNPIQNFLNLSNRKFSYLQIPDTEKIDAAVRLALGRASKDIYEPIVVIFKDENLPNFKAYFLLEFQTLLLAHSYILTLSNRKVHLYKVEAQNYLLKLREEQEKIKEYSKIIRGQKQLIEQRHQLLEKQQFKLFKQSQDISKLNKRLTQIGQLLSLQGKKAFQTTYAGVNAICSNTNEIVDIGKLLSEELLTIRTASQLITELSHQVRHLAVQAAIIANKSGTELDGFSQITSEIGKLMSQTLEAGRKTDQIADEFRLRLEELTESAQSGTKVARSLIRKIKEAEIEFAQIIQIETCVINGTTDNLEIPIEEMPEAPQELVEKISRAEKTLSELKELVKYKESVPLVEKIKRALEHHNKTKVK